MSRLDDLRSMRAFIDREIAAEIGPHAATVHNGMIGDVAELYGVEVADILGGNRRHQVAHARQGVAWLLKRSGMSNRDISRTLGFSDHSTAWYAVRKVDADPAARALLLGLEGAV